MTALCGTERAVLVHPHETLRGRNLGGLNGPTDIIHVIGVEECKGEVDLVAVL